MKSIKAIKYAIPFFLIPISNMALAEFKDILPSHPYYQAVTYLEEQAIISGYDDGKFRPEKSINRVEFTKIIVGSELQYNPSQDPSGYDIYAPVDLSFSDIQSGEWYVPYLRQAKQAKWINGYPDGTFQPNRLISFAEAAKIIVTAFNYEIIDNTTIWYEPYISTLSEQNAIPSTITNLSKKITRGEMSEIIYRLKNNITEKDSLTYDDLIGKEMAYNNTLSQITDQEAAEIDIFSQAYSALSINSICQNDNENIYMALKADIPIIISTNQGITWQEDMQGITKMPNGDYPRINKIVSDDHFTERLWACGENGIYRKDDNNDQWIKMPSNIDEEDQEIICQNIIINPLKAGDIYFIHSDQYLYHSTNDGLSWQSITINFSQSDTMEQENPNIFDVVIDPDEPTVLWLATSNGLYIYDQQSTTLQKINTGFNGQISGITIVDQWSNKIIAGGSAGITVSHDGGETWEMINIEDKQPFITVWHQAKNNHNLIFAGGFMADQIFSGDGQIWFSADAGENWSKALLPTAPSNNLQTIYQLKSGEIMAGGTANYYLISKDDGQIWQQTSIKLSTP